MPYPYPYMETHRQEIRNRDRAVRVLHFMKIAYSALDAIGPLPASWTGDMEEVEMDVHGALGHLSVSIGTLEDYIDEIS